MAEKPKLIPLASLVEDLSIYPRNRVDTTHVSDIIRALDAGVELPPIVAEVGSFRIVDGVHRSRAYRKKVGDAASVLVILRQYRDEAALFEDAVRLNAEHGRKLDRHDQTRIVLKFRELKVDDETIASALHVPTPAIQTLELRVVRNSDTGEAIPSKRGLEFMRGQKVTPVQIKAMQSVRSADVGRLALELMRLLDARLVDLEDDQIVERLEMLGRAIQKVLKRVRVTA